MQSTFDAALPSRHAGFSLVEVAVAIALLGIATVLSLPRFNHLANHAPPSELMHSHPDTSPGGGTVVIDWGGYATNADANYHTFAKPDAASGDKCQVTSQSTQTPSSAATPKNLDANGC